MEIHAHSQLKLTLVQDLHQRKLHIKRKLEPWRAEKCTPRVSGNNAPVFTNRKTYRSPASPYTIKSVGGNSRKFDAKVTQIHGQSYRGAMAALTQVTNLHKAEDVANLKM